MTANPSDHPVNPTEPSSPSLEDELQPTDISSNPPSFGWSAYAERINGRFAMIGFVALLVLELVTRQDFFTWLGF